MTSRKALETQLDAATRELVKLIRDYTCERCSGPGGDWAHYFGRAQRTVRWVLANSFCFCRACHQYMDSHLPEFTEFIKNKIGAENFRELGREAYKVGKWPLEKLEEYLKSYRETIRSIKGQTVRSFEPGGNI